VERLAHGGRLGILTSGGDAPGMNAAVRAAVKVAYAEGHVPVGIIQGFRGLIDGTARPLTLADVEGIQRLGGTVLGSARALDFRTDEGRARAAQAVVAMELDALLVIGGNGSLTGAHAARDFLTASGKKLAIVGIPASIDNDIGHTSLAIGVDTALNTIVEACDRISDTAASHNRAFLVEVMGRDCGYLAMAAAVATGADAVLFRESGRSVEALVEQAVGAIERAFSRNPPKPRVLILKAEGVQMPVGELKDHIDAELAKRGRAVETRVTVLGHVVRGGAPSAQDRLLAGRLGRAAAFAAIEGQTDVMIGWQRSGLAGPGGQQSPHDPYCWIAPLEDVLRETQALLSGESPVARWRSAALAEAEELFQL
jgi:6-phosphofructokinase 1